MAYQPDDDRFYDSLNRSGSNYQDLRRRVAEDQADTTRQIGQMYGQAIPNTLNGILQGANWATKRAKDEQDMEAQRQALALQQAQEGRQVAEEGRRGAKFGEEQKDWADKDAERAYGQAGAEEAYAKAAGVDYVPGMTHKDVQRAAAGASLGMDARKLAQAKELADMTQAGENARSQANIGATGARQQELLAFDREKLAQEGDLKAQLMAAKAPKEAPAETLVKLSDLSAAEKSLQDLSGEWTKHASGNFAGVLHNVPGTDAARYDDAVEVHAQTIANALKGGRSVTPADIERAKKMLPNAVDSQSRAEEKLNRLSSEIAAKKFEHAKALQGYNVNVDADGKGSQFHLGADEGTAAYAADDGNADLSPADLQAKMRGKANQKPIHQMTRAEVQAELNALRGGQ